MTEKGTHKKYEELEQNAKTKALANIEQLIRVKLGLPTGTRMVDRSLTVCVILKLDPVFDEKGNIISHSKIYKEVTNELVKQIYDQCAHVQFRQDWGYKWIESGIKSYLKGYITHNQIKGEIHTAKKLEISKEDFEKIIDGLSSYKESERYKNILKIFEFEKIK